MKKSYKQSCIVFSSDSSIMKIAIYCNSPEKNLAKSDRSFRTAPWHIKLGIAKYCILELAKPDGAKGCQIFNQGIVLDNLDVIFISLPINENQ